jgi:uncharacterized protein YndB with AHSA1/START domain
MPAKTNRPSSRSANALALRRDIRTSPANVYRALTRSSLLRDWFCQASQVEARSGGRVYLWWHPGSAVSGTYTALQPDKKVGLTWIGQDDPGPSRVTIRLAGHNGGTRVTVRQTITARGPAAARSTRRWSQLWSDGLANLQSLLETGQDLRYTRRPMLGINVGDFNPEIAKRLGVPVNEGVRLDGLVEEMGAARAGLQKDDVIVSIDGKKTVGWRSLAPVLERRRAGDAVPVVFYRRGEKKTVRMTLSARPMPSIPPDPKDLARELRRLFARVNRVLEDALADASEEAAETRPQPGEWNAKETLAHLIASERDSHAWIAMVVEDDDAETFPDNVHVRVEALVRAFPTVPALLDELRRDQEITASMVENLRPETVARKWAYWKLGHNLLQPDDHVLGHAQQIRDALKSARETG